MKESNKSYVQRTLQDLIDSSKEAVAILIEDIRTPLDPDLSDEKRRNAIKAKKECFIDAQEILIGISKLETQITEGDLKEEKDFEKGLAEKFAKR
jgi:hypothetical protein|tara:strand:- start:5863 stop:6147 length:285 start_codon:yes stop_codon:yes gene_type:complete